jgi:hypothetical protein
VSTGHEVPSLAPTAIVSRVEPRAFELQRRYAELPLDFAAFALGAVHFGGWVAELLQALGRVAALTAAVFHQRR